MYYHTLLVSVNWYNPFGKKFDATYVDENEMFIFLSQLLAFLKFILRKINLEK